MALTILKNKVAIVLGADNAVGRAVSLQLSREGVKVVLAGFQEEKLEELERLILSKDGLPFVAPLLAPAAKNADIFRVAREQLGHFHLVVNAMGYGAAPSDAPDSALEEAREVAPVLVESLAGRGAVRYLTIWPRESADLPAPGAPTWHAVVCAGEDLLDAADKGDGLRPAAVADAAVRLLQCPPGACPVMTRLEYRHLG